MNKMAKRLHAKANITGRARVRIEKLNILARSAFVFKIIRIAIFCDCYVPIFISISHSPLTRLPGTLACDPTSKDMLKEAVHLQ